MLIFPAIDLLEGEAVRLYQGDYNKKTVYNTDPLEVAVDFKNQGATCIHLVDLEGGCVIGFIGCSGLADTEDHAAILAGLDRFFARKGWK